MRGLHRWSSRSGRPAHFGHLAEAHLEASLVPGRAVGSARAFGSPPGPSRRLYVTLRPWMTPIPRDRLEDEGLMDFPARIAA